LLVIFNLCSVLSITRILNILFPHPQVCQAQIHFARREEGEKTEMPHFAGQKGPEIMRGLMEIENTFEKNLASLRHVKKTILDVKATSWHDDYNK